MNRHRLHPDPGSLPTKPAPKRGDEIKFRVNGLPPFKELRASIRNPNHRYHCRFEKLRAEAIKAMRGRCWYDGPVSMDVRVYSNKLDPDKVVIDYSSGISDTLDGSHGVYFTYLPIAYQDDCQVASSRTELIDSEKSFYEVKIKFL